MSALMQMRYLLALADKLRAGEAGEGHARPDSSSTEHRGYWNEKLDDTFCAACGNYWPCVPARDSITCKCGHVGTVHAERGTGECWTAACGCRWFRLQGVEAE